MNTLHRSRNDKKISGLCGGAAKWLNMDSNLLRLIVVITTFFSAGTVFLIYIVASMVIPVEPRIPPNDSQYFGQQRYERYDDYRQGEDHFDRGYHQAGSTTTYSSAGADRSHLDDMMKDIEKKAMKKEIDELKEKIAQYERNNTKNN